MTTKILALVDGLGNLVRFALMPGQRSEITGAKQLIGGPVSWGSAGGQGL